MTRERIIELLDLVLLCNRKGKDITVSLDVAAYHIDVNVFYHSEEPEPGVSMYSYTYSVGSSLVDGIKTIFDPDLKKAEEHLRRIIDDVDR